MKLTKHQLKIIPIIQRKYNVSIAFLKSNLANIEKFLWYALSPRLVIKRIAIRKCNKPRVILNYYHLRRVLFDQAERKVIKTRRRNVQQWSRQMVCYLRKKYGTKEHIEITSLGDNLDVIDTSKKLTPRGGNMAPEEVSKQLKEQLELLRSGKRIVPLMERENKSAENEIIDTDSTQKARGNLLEENPNFTPSAAKCSTKHTREDVINECSHTTTEVLNKTEGVVQSTLETTPEKQIIGRVDTRLEQPKHSYKADRNIDVDGETVELSPTDGTKAASRPEIYQHCSDKSTSKPLSSNSNFLDMLMNKVRGKRTLNDTSTDSTTPPSRYPGSRSPERSFDKSLENNDHFTDSGEEFFGFDETERLPGMMLTPVVPFSAQSKGNANAAFVSESLNEFMRENLLESSNCVADSIENAAGRKHRQATLDGLVTPDCIPPRIDMPLVPESLQKLRTVAERRQYLQKFNRNHKLSIINNEAAICRELQRKMRHQKSKSVSQQLLQAPNSQMPFTRQGWQAASFVTTEFNHYYYQTLDVSDGQERERVRLPGVRGNNEERDKQSYHSRVPSNVLTRECKRNNCSDALVWRDLKPLKTEPDKKKLNKSPLPSVFKPCPLSHKPFQKPLDDETTPLLLGGGSMAVVRMPVVELEVFPALGKPLHEVARRYLEYILPNCDITREWAEFSVSTLQQSADYNQKETPSNQTNDKIILSNGPPESFSFPIPYQNDRSHILVRRVVDRSEKLDETFETAASCVEDFTFRTNIDERDNVLVECADVLSEMINCVAISCSENSFIKIDPDGLQVDNAEEDIKYDKTVDKWSPKDDKIANNKMATDDSKQGNQAAAHKKQNRLLLELRRLNATIIDAAVKAEKGAKPCTKEYCALGCVCKSLADDYPLRQHCGKSKCVIECTCKGTNQSRIMRLETDGRSITTEDAFMLRRKATARLARMEKEFTSTIVLTENETLLINESQYDKKRRCTKAPKRYEDFADTDDDYIGRSAAIIPPNKSQNAAVVSIEAATESSPNSGFSETTTELREPIYVRDKELEQLKHCTIPLVRFASTQNMAVWCMVHELYKCYCGGRATDGKPLVIEKDSGGHTTTSNDQASLGSKQNVLAEEEYSFSSTKARYSFEKVEEEVEEEEEENQEQNRSNKKQTEKRKSTDRKTQGSVVKYISSDDERSESDRGEDVSEDSLCSDFEAENPRAKRPKLLTKRQERRGRPSEINFINKYFNTETDSCRRVVVVPRKTYLRLNRKRRAEVQDFKAKHESKQTMLLLNEHILRSVYYHKHEVEKQRKEATQEALAQFNKKRKLQEGDISEVADGPKKELYKEKTEPVRKKTLNDKDRQIVELTDEDSCQSSRSSLLSMSSSKPTSHRRLRKRSRQQEKSNSNTDRCSAEFESNVLVEDNSLSDLTASAKSNRNGPSENTIKNLEDETKSLDIQKNHNTNDLVISDDAEPSGSSISGYTGADEPATDISSVATECSAELSLNMQPSSSLSHSRIDFFRDVVRSMNSLVNKKMQDIGLALKRESKVIPAPNNEILCIIKWSNFLDAFNEGFVFIWQVKLRDDQTFFAATISNMMPMVLDAVGVINIAALPIPQLPLLGRMLLQRCRSNQTRDLAIVMQGRAKYWLVKGFLRADKSSACAKPTPKSHPLLTRKINVLSSLLAKQHIRELNKKVVQKQNEQLRETPDAEKSNSTVSAQNSSKVQPSLPSPVLREQKVSANISNNNSKSTCDMLNAKQGSSGRKTQQQNKLQPPIVRCPVPPSTISSSTLTTIDKSKSYTGLSKLQELIGSSHYTEMKTNITFRNLTSLDINDLDGLDVTSEPHRWLVLDLYKDFSHIYVPDFQELVSLDRIQKVMTFSRQKQKIVKLQFFQNAAYDAFVTPTSQRKIYFGPLKLNTPPPLLILLQSVDGKMVLRESYQQMHNIQADSNDSTSAFWLIRKNGQVHPELELPGNTEGVIPVEEEPIGEIHPSKAKQQSNFSESDDDCMIVEKEESLVPFSPIVPLSQPNITLKSLSDLQTESNQPALARQLTNFTIQKSANSNRLQITNNGTTAEAPTSLFQNLPNTTEGDVIPPTQIPIIPMKLPLNTQFVPLSGAAPSQQIVPMLDEQPAPILCGLPPNAVITGVTPAPQEAPYATTIFISSLSSTASTVTGSTQLHDKQVTAITQPSTTVSSASVFSHNIANTNSTAITGTFGTTSNVRFLTPDVRVTATADSPATANSSASPTLATICNVNPTIFSKPTAQQQGNALLEHSSGLSTQSTITSNDHSVTEQQQLPTDDKNSTNTSTVAWKRFMLDENSKSSTIGSTTITKMAEKVESPTRIGVATKPLITPTSLEESEFEPVASIVFKPEAVLTSKEAKNSYPLMTNIVPTHGTLNLTTNTASETTTTITSTTKAASSKAVPLALSQPIPLRKVTSSVSKTAPTGTKSEVTSHKLSPVKEPPKERHIMPKKSIAKFAPFSYGTSAKITTNNTTKINSTDAMSKTQNTTISISNNFIQSFVQQLKIPSQPLRPLTAPSFGARLSLPSSTHISSTTATTSQVINANSVSTPKPLISVRPAVPIPQRMGTGNSATQRRSDSALLGPSIVNMKGGAVMTTRTVPAQYTVSQNIPSTTSTTLISRPATATIVTPKPRATVNANTTFKSGACKADEQYGIFCSGSIDSSPRFWAKRVKNSYIIKVPGLSTVVHRTDLESVNTYLNQHLMRQSPAMKSKLPVKWKFVPSDQLNLPIKMLTSNRDGSTTEKFLVRRVKAAENDSSATKGVSSSPVYNFLKDVAKVPASTPDTKCTEPILIED
ncbi:PREDICTED: uncharacterized protein LOC108367502 isoform X2 [Rhagoletis zephyria]|uniref:uncharacterized protein LOC108367502 isoform X1 n=1 Tax=Rhagoletis zephyria TaxID=28612 RepID=UPI0008119897|nr:PREDICTED: uncharacterized protein LOC108367502 isoform X1 [Rhagoletis zephyria]XP_017477610.1 PREDICTED: uncharacterized protein LOC108367502 isoform X2 [Rhagoletis zephyria]